MDEQTLKQAARNKGYSGDLCVFLDKLEKNMQLVGLGKYCVEEALADGAAEYTVVKVALANIGRAFTDFEQKTEDGEKSRNDYTTADWAKEGEDEFARHCTPTGKFRYGDFRYTPQQKYEPCGGLFC